MLSSTTITSAQIMKKDRKTLNLTSNTTMEIRRLLEDKHYRKNTLMRTHTQQHTSA